jgi:glyoxylase-like metal-dependent hydrolase (beta-lactamase superfamily II)
MVGLAMQLPDFLKVPSFGARIYVLRDAKGLYLIDSGFIGGRERLREALVAQGWERERIVGIILTHGHLDHILNAGRIARETGAWIAAPRLDAEFYEGRQVYPGMGKITGALEAAGRVLLGFERFSPSRLFDDGDDFDVWEGLRAVHLPGHTPGHSGLYCARLRLLFCGDLFASYRMSAHTPPRIFSVDPERIPESIGKALAMDLAGVLPQHCDGASPEVHLERLRGLAER